MLHNAAHTPLGPKNPNYGACAGTAAVATGAATAAAMTTEVDASINDGVLLIHTSFADGTCEAGGYVGTDKNGNFISGSNNSFNCFGLCGGSKEQALAIGEGGINSGGSSSNQLCCMSWGESGEMSCCSSDGCCSCSYGIECCGDKGSCSCGTECCGGCLESCGSSVVNVVSASMDGCGSCAGASCEAIGQCAGGIGECAGAACHAGVTCIEVAPQVLCGVLECMSAVLGG